jgi:hypothetical protein
MTPGPVGCGIVLRRPMKLKELFGGAEVHCGEIANGDD